MPEIFLLIYLIPNLLSNYGMDVTLKRLITVLPVTAFFLIAVINCSAADGFGSMDPEKMLEEQEKQIAEQEKITEAGEKLVEDYDKLVEEQEKIQKRQQKLNKLYQKWQKAHQKFVQQYGYDPVQQSQQQTQQAQQAQQGQLPAAGYDGYGTSGYGQQIPYHGN